MYAFNLTGEVGEMRQRHDLVEVVGGTCVMASRIRSASRSCSRSAGTRGCRSTRTGTPGAR
jgi:hypothetical protein